MVYLSDLTHKRVLILGYGKEGQSSERYIKKHVPGVDISVADKKDDPNYLLKQNGADFVIKTPGIAKEQVTVPYTTATNIFFEKCRGTVIGVTGSKGKSTTASLIHHLLQSAGFRSHLVGNIGNPALDELDRTHDFGKGDFFVYEASSYQLDDIAFSPQISVVVSLFPEHMDYHLTKESYFKAKRNMLSHMNINDSFVYNPSFETLKKWASEIKGKAIPYEKSLPVTMDQVKLIGDHNRQNMLAAVTVAHLLHIPDAVIIPSITSFCPLSHRLERVGTFKGITFYDDAISTTPESTIAALDAIDNVDTILLGGLDRGYDFSKLVHKVIQKKINNVVLFPDTGATIKKELQKFDLHHLSIFETRSMDEAVDFAYKKTKVGGVCLLSTASPSYSIWKNFEEKGSLFSLQVRTYAKKP